MPLFEVQCSEVISALTTSARGVAHQMLGMVNQSVEVRIQDLHESWVVAHDTVKRIPSNEEELSNLKDYLRDVKKLVIEPNVNALRKDPDNAVAFQINLLNDFNFPDLKPEIVEEAYDMLHWSYTVEEAVQFRKGEIEIEKTKFMKRSTRRRRSTWKT
jgi:outer membrane lipoprotein-sorting protein